jgi:hypothetical protein
MVATALRLKDVITVITIRQKAREPTIGTKHRITRVTGTRAAFVTVTITHNTNATTKFKSIGKNPLERAPG